jgi:2-oxoglutarate dehydrogenase complex dehydrogenase (E1) component-like enzyme
MQKGKKMIDSKVEEAKRKWLMEEMEKRFESKLKPIEDKLQQILSELNLVEGLVLLKDDSKNKGY